MYQYFISKYFKKKAKKYLKKHRSLLTDLISCLKKFNINSSINLGDNTYKLRVASRDLKKGKSKSFRIIILLIKRKNLITPIALFFKGDRENISKAEILIHAKEVRSELKEL